MLLHDQWKNIVSVCAEEGLVVLIVSLVVGILVLLVVVIGSLMCCLKKRRPAKRYKHICPFFSVSGSLTHINNHVFFILFVFDCGFRVYFFTDASKLPQDSSTRCFGQAVQEAVLVLVPRKSASLYLWSLQQLKHANLCPLLLPDHRLEHWSPAERLPRSVSAPDCSLTITLKSFPHQELLLKQTVTMTI